MSSSELPPDERGELRTEVGQTLILIGMLVGLIVAGLLIGFVF